MPVSILLNTDMNLKSLSDYHFSLTYQHAYLVSLSYQLCALLQYIHDQQW